MQCNLGDLAIYYETSRKCSSIAMVRMLTPFPLQKAGGLNGVPVSSA